MNSLKQRQCFLIQFYNVTGILYKVFYSIFYTKLRLQSKILVLLHLSYKLFQTVSTDVNSLSYSVINLRDKRTHFLVVKFFSCTIVNY